MDLFSITCTTCKSRLKVREEAAVGQILACPKCGGMVMVKAPPGAGNYGGR
jgi:DNA-directed RNA polymerase subunit RPC12/RpoP